MGCDGCDERGCTKDSTFPDDDRVADHLSSKGKGRSIGAPRRFQKSKPLDLNQALDRHYMHCEGFGGAGKSRESVRDAAVSFRFDLKCVRGAFLWAT